MIKALSKHRVKYIGLFILIVISFVAYYAQEEYEASITEHSTKTIEVIVNESIYVAKSTPSSNSYTKIISNKGGMYKMPLNKINIFNKGDILSLNLSEEIYLLL